MLHTQLTQWLLAGVSGWSPLTMTSRTRWNFEFWHAQHWSAALVVVLSLIITPGGLGRHENCCCWWTKWHVPAHPSFQLYRSGEQTQRFCSAYQIGQPTQENNNIFAQIQHQNCSTEQRVLKVMLVHAQHSGRWFTYQAWRHHDKDYELIKTMSKEE